MLLEIIICVPLLLFVLSAYKKNIAAFMVSKMTKKANEMLGEHKEQMLKKLNEEAARAGKHNYKVLELGGGSGSNYQFVKTPVDWTVTEPNKCFAPYFDENVKKLGGQHRIHDLIEAFGEDLGQFEDDSFDDELQDDLEEEIERRIIAICSNYDGSSI